MPFSTREMLEAIEQRKPIYTLFTSLFGEKHTHLTEILEIDVKKGKRTMAPFVAPRVGGKVLTRQGFTRSNITAPKIAPERVLTIDDINKAGLGENVYSTKTPEEREAVLLANDMTDLEESILRRTEWMCRQIILEGKINVKDEDAGVDVQIDYNLTNQVILSAAKKWNTATGTILADLKAWRRKIIQSTGIAPKTCLMASDVVDTFKENEGIKAAFNLNMNLGTITPRVDSPALTFIGRLVELDLDIYTYDEWFANDDGTEGGMLPEGTVILLPLKVGAIEYGAVTQMEAGKFVTYEGEIIPRIYADEKNSIKTLTLTSRPIPRPFDVDSWYVAKVM